MEDNINDTDEMEDSKPPAVVDNNPPSLEHIEEEEKTDNNNEVDNRMVYVQGEVPFLVTHWLSGFAAKGSRDVINNDEISKEQKDAFLKIQKATAELASAFGTLGVFGTVTKTNISSLDPKNSFQNQMDTSEAITARSYADMKRTWWNCSTTHLETLLQSCQSTSVAVDSSFQNNNTNNHIHASTETVFDSINHPENGGRTLQDAIVISENATETDLSKDTVQPSALHRPIHLPQPHQPVDNKEKNNDTEKTRGDNKPTISILSSVEEISKEASKSMREYLDIRNKFQQDNFRLRTSERSMVLQKKKMIELEEKRKNLTIDNNNDSKVLELQLDEINAAEQDATRTISALERHLLSSRQTQKENTIKLKQTREKAMADFIKAKMIMSTYRDPIPDNIRPNNCLKNRVIKNLWNRQMGIERYKGQSIPRSMGRIRGGGLGSTTTMEIQKATLHNRFSYAATINAHLSYPVYCMRFDKTGRYFITGADDYLVKVFCIGGSVNVIDKSHPIDPTSYTRGAVLVCTLKGHAGVINDIGVSSDNSFLATASEDGDCRIWGLKDGCPVAILRGHTGGTNMVSWSSLTPYRLVTVGADGWARTWDIRQACLKRYGSLIGNRPEYTLRVYGRDILGEKEKAEKEKRILRKTDGINGGIDRNLSLLPSANGNGAASSEVQVAVPPPNLPTASNDAQTVGAQNIPIPAPPLPPAAASDQVIPQPPIVPPPGLGEAIASQLQPDAGAVDQAIPLPPLPPAANAQPANADRNDEEVVSGQFVANDIIDEGVKIITKFQHGATVEERMVGPGTRARRSGVKVICVARCPHGGHFATGSDDGICRVWLEEEDDCVAKVDSLVVCSGRQPAENSSICGSKLCGRSERLLFSLKGHLGPITDLQYSKTGDRILTACQKDGVVRIFSFCKDPAFAALEGTVSERKFFQLTIKLTKPNAETSRPTARQRPRAGSNREHKATVSCDVASWMPDNSMIVTSQSEPSNQSGVEIVPGSQYIFLWSSVSGHCLLGFPGAHTKQCHVVLPHPTLSSIICSAGADGFVKFWDWETGECIFTHQNNSVIGPIDANDRGKSFGYLDGDFSPDGASLVLSDDSGRITVFDSSLSRSMVEHTTISTPDWMTEQYFSNDYYDLIYDTTGYCIERNSQKPPHLAPRGSRCTHSGAPFAEQVNDVFRGLNGPLPVCSTTARWNREEIRRQAATTQRSIAAVLKNVVGQYDPNITKLVRDGQVVTLSSIKELQPIRRHSGSPGMRLLQEIAEGSSSNRLSSNYRWRGYDDIIRELANEEVNGEQPDSDDGEWENERRARPTQNSLLRAQPQVENLNESDSDEELVLDEEGNDEQGTDERPVPSRTSQRRRRRIESDEEDASDSGDDFVEYMSSNNTPHGPFVADYDVHHFRIERNKAEDLHRVWVHRNESTSSYNGRRKYSPQVGDSVVYIARAHSEMIQHFPSLEAPWLHWPEEAVWPVVRCCVRNIRYRFPYKYYRGECRSVVAVLTLEVTGIPELSSESRFGWPSPSFISPTRSHLFELSVFENDCCDYVVPFNLYESRLRCLERALTRSGSGVLVDVFYAVEGDADQDALYESYGGRITEFACEDSEANDVNLLGSGFECLKVTWMEQNDFESGNISPWEVTVKNQRLSEPDHGRPSLDEEEKQRVREAITKIRSMPHVDHFLHPVPPAYSDYLCRVEVPMDINFISSRLEADYYGSRFSVAADMRLIYINCVKYNGEHDDLSASAEALRSKFEELVLNDDERDIFRKFDVPVVGPVAPVQEREVDHSQRTPSTSALVTRRTTRRQEPIRNDNHAVQSNTSGNQRRTRSRALRIRISNRQQRSVLENLQPASSRNLEQLANGTGVSTRGRRNGRRTSSAARNENLENASSTEPTRVIRRSIRPGLRNSGVVENSVEDHTGSVNDLRRSSRNVRINRNVTVHPPRPDARSSHREESSVPALRAENESSARGLATRTTGRSVRHSPLEAEHRDDTRESTDDDDQQYSYHQNEDDDDDDYSAEVSGESPARRSSRRSRRMLLPSSNLDSENSPTASGPQVARAVRPAIRRSSRRTERVNLNGTMDQSESDDDDDESPVRRSSRRGRKAFSPSYESESENSPTESGPQTARAGRPSARRSSRRTEHSNQTGTSMDDDYSNNSPQVSGSENNNSTFDSRVRPRHSTRLRVKIQNGEYSQSEGETTGDDETAKSPVQKRRKSKKASPSPSNSEEDDDFKIGRPNSRARAHQDDSSFGEANVGSESEDESESFDDDDNDVGSNSEASEGSPKAKRKRPRASRTAKARARPKNGGRKGRSTGGRGKHEQESSFRASHKRATRTSTYLDPSSSEFDSDSPAKPSAKRRSAAKPKKKANSRKRKATSTQQSRKKRKSQIDETMNKFEILSWREINPAHITKLARELLHRLREKDEYDIFAKPVAEAYPDSAVDYMQKIPNPLDFRTIEEERLNVYKSIRELQEDLILVFSNCMAYNNDNTSYYTTAQTLLLELNELYENVCFDEKVHMSRRSG